MTKAITLLALTCVLVVGAAATSILARDSIPAAGIAAAMPDLKQVVPNREDKQDKLMVVASLPEAQPQPQQAASGSSEPAASQQTANQAGPDENQGLRQAYASSNDAELEAAKAAAMLPAVAPAAAEAHPAQETPSAPPKAKVASHARPEKYALLSDAQIAGIKERLRLSPDQEYYWPAVDKALHAIARKVEAARHVNPHANAGSLDPDSPEVQELKSAAMPLLFQLREDQKDEVRKLARVIGLEKVAAAI